MKLFLMLGSFGLKLLLMKLKKIHEIFFIVDSLLSALNEWIAEFFFHLN